MQYRQKAHYPLKQVKELVRKGKWLIKGNARTDAEHCFGWNGDDIKRALLALRPSHFYKSEPSMCIPGITIDYYKAERLFGENVYIHFYIDPQGVVLVVNSFKRI